MVDPLHPSTDDLELERFLEAQAKTYATALAEIQAGQKKSHWMWYIFPQIHGLGWSPTSVFYAIRSRQEAELYLKHPLLGGRLTEIATALLAHRSKTAQAIFGPVDALKLRSSMTLFAQIPTAPSVFREVLETFFQGQDDPQTLEILNR